MNKKGFTIIELLIVIVVIAILATITIVAYNGITKRAEESSIKSDLSNYAKRLETQRIANGSDVYADDLAIAGINTSSSSRVSNYQLTDSKKTYCLEMSERFYISNESPLPQEGGCGALEGVVAWWPMNGSPDDIEARNLNSQATDITSVTDRKGRAGKAYQFNGSTSQITCGTSTLVRPGANTPVTISALVYLTAYPVSEAGIFSSGGVDGLNLTVLNNGAVRFRLGNKLVSTSVTSQYIPLNQWRVIRGSYVGSATAGGMTLSLMTIDEDSNSASGAVASSSATGISVSYNATPCAIGSMGGASGSFLSGRIDDIRVYKTNSTANFGVGF